MTVQARLAAALPFLSGYVPARIPGAVLGIVAADGTRAVAVRGLAQRVPAEAPLARETFFDLASLTKVLFTTPAILHQVAAGRIGLDDPLTAAIPDLRQYDPQARERRLTFRQCLAHATHLPAVEPLYTYGQDPATLRAFILQRVWQPGPPVYSDINFILLGFAMERHAGKGIRDMDPGPGFAFQAAPDDAAATEDCTWRLRVLSGEVTPALRGPTGFHILKLIERRQPSRQVVTEYHARQILIRPSELVTPAQAEQQARDLYDRIVNKHEDFAKLAREYSKDPTTANAGGDMDWFLKDDWGSTIAQQLDKLQPGQVSQPFQSEAGWHILKLEATRQQDRTADLERNQARQAIGNRKA